MTRTLHIKLLLLGYLVLAALQIDAQGWEKKYSPDATMYINTVYPVSGNNYLITGWGDNEYFQRVMKINDNGDVVWKSDVDSVYSISTSNITQDEGLIIMGSSAGGPGYTMVRIDSTGNKLWQRAFHPNLTVFGSSGNRDIDTTTNGGFICTYSAQDTALPGSHPQICVSRLDGSGNIIWDRRYYPLDTSPVAYGIRSTRDGGFIVTGSDGPQRTLFCFKIDSNGNTLWQYTPPAQNFLQPSMANDGNIWILSEPFYGGGPNTILKLDQNGNTIWSQSYTIPDSAGWIGQVTERSDHSLALIGATPLRYGVRYSLSIVDTMGNTLLYRRISTSNLGYNLPLINTNYKSVAQSHEDGFVIGCWVNHQTGYTGFLIKTDSNGLVYPSLLSGNVFFDANDNCSKDAGEIYLTPVYLTLTGGGDSFATVTVDSGYFSLGLYTGSYGIQVQPPSPYWQPSSCDPASISLSSGTDSSMLLGLTPILSSPYITINGHMSRQVICRPTVYTAQYCNTGTVPFTGSIEIDIDTLLHIDSASIHIASQTGNQLTFNVDTLGIMQCASIEVYCTVACGPSNLSRTTCTNAQAFQDTIVNPSPLWDRSNLRMSVAYNSATDSITFTLKNYGTGGMSGPKGMIVIEDNVILMTLPTQLIAGAQVQQQIKANGATWRATIAQTDYNPYSKFTTAAIEAAGTNASGGVSLGYINQYPYNGYTSYQDNTCAEIYGSYDPNEKTVAPKGAGPNQLIDTNVALEYTIDFQNTGTAPAYTVVVTDTLAPYLDPATARLEISSSHCQMQISGRNLITFTFDNINLPDTSAGQQQSTGFVKFRVNQKPGNPNGTVINNKAGVYFDYNTPVITNTATVRIGQVLVTGIQNVYAEKAVLISAYPNPFLSNTTIKVDGENFADLQLDIYDINGQLVKHKEAKNSNSFVVDRNTLNTGDYIFKITSNGKPVGNGKIIAQ